MEKYYLTTAITYASGTPHIGNDYEIILSDAIARFKRLEGYDVRFQTGTDEHGQKIQEKAKAANVSPKEFVDKTSSYVKENYKLLNISYDKFIRTTDADHEKMVQDIFQKLYDQGDIYLGKYEGWYCVPCEAFFTETQAKDNEYKCKDCGRPLTKSSEEAYFFKLSKYQDRLIKHIHDNPEFIQPESRKNEMLNNFLKEELPDLCVSRTSFDWGIKVPFDPKHVIYVWIDALSNYYTGLGEPNGELSKKYWPANVHIIGKDILRFHTIYWPIMLMALGIELPKQVFGHPWILFGNDKMSKSKGNIMYTKDLVDEFGVDAVRYYAIHEIPFASDGSITYELLMERINADLVNNLSNLVNRTISMSIKYFNGEVKNTNNNQDVDADLKTCALNMKNDCIKHMNEFRLADAFEDVFIFLRRANKYIDETEPWILGRSEENHDRLHTVLYNLLESIRYATVFLQAFIPETAEKIFNMLKTNKRDFASTNKFGEYEGATLDKPEVLFQRIDVNAKIKELEAKHAPKRLETKPEITIDDFDKVDIRVGVIKSCEKHPKADKLLVSQIDIDGEVRQIVSGIASYYKPEEMVGKHVLVVVNLKPVTLRGVESFGMILCEEKDKELKVLEAKLDSGANIR